MGRSRTRGDNRKNKKAKGPKTPVVIEQPTGEKKATHEPFVDSDSKTPVWRISKLEMVDPFGWHEISAQELQKVRERLAAFETMPWHKFFGPMHPSHNVATADLCREARRRLKELQLDQLDELASLRVTGAIRVWGIREGRVFVVLWWDPNHQVCPSNVANN